MSESESFSCCEFWFSVGAHSFTRIRRPPSLLSASPSLETYNAPISWWCHDMEKNSALLASCERNPRATSRLLSQRAGNAELWCWFLLMARTKCWRNSQVASLRPYGTHVTSTGFRSAIPRPMVVTRTKENYTVFECRSDNVVPLD